MKKRPPRKTTWIRSAVAMAAGACVVCSALAQSAEGYLHGKGKAGTTVSLLNLETGLQRQLQVSPDGTFNFAKLPPGRYRVSSGDVALETTVAMGAGTEVELAALEVSVSAGGRGLVRLDMDSAESTTLFTRQQLGRLPVARNAQAVALLAPGAVKGDPGLGGGGLPSFGGASVAENGYYINGFDVTNLRDFLSYADLPFDAIEQQQVKTGGFGAEYGRSLGGVISIVTRRGTNEWKGGAALYWEPQALRASGRDVRDRELGREGRYTLYQSRDEQENRSAVAYLGGPLIQDRLFLFALVEGRHDETLDFDQSTNTRAVSDHPTGMYKLDWQPDSRHRFELTRIFNKKRTRYVDYTNATQYSPTFDGVGRSSTKETGGDVSILKYTGNLTDDFTVSVLGGRVDYLVDKQRGARTNSACPVVLEVDLSEIGCWPGPWPGPNVRDPQAPDDLDQRRAWRLDLEYRLGQHTLRGGVDTQRFRSSAAGVAAFAGAYYRYFVSEDGSVNDVPGVLQPGQQYVRQRIVSTTSGAYRADNQAFYIEDSWQATPDLMLYGGLRTESFRNRSSDGTTFVRASGQLAPRTGFAWNAQGDGRLRIFGTAGRYFIPVATNTNVRLTYSEYWGDSFHTFDHRDPQTQAPVGMGDPIGGVAVYSDGRPINPARVADQQLKPMSQDEFVLGFQRAVSPQWSLGVKGTYRSVNNGMDDFCGHAPMVNWAKDQGHADFNPDSLAPCVLMNPGRGVSLNMDVNNDGVDERVHIPASYFGLPKYRRTYRAMEFSLERPFDGKWELQASYTWARSVGNVEGYVQSSVDQDDAGITQDFDAVSFTHGANGYLPNDRRHTFKLFGSYALTDRVRVGLNATIASGRPISCLGYVPATAADYDDTTGYTTAGSYYCVGDDGKSHLNHRGSAGRTPWTHQLDVQLAYVLPLERNTRLTLQADVFNILNRQEVIDVDETGDYRQDADSAVRRSLNYGQPKGFSGPRYVRLTARYEF